MNTVKVVAGPTYSLVLFSAPGLKRQQPLEPSLFHAATALSIPESLTSPRPSFHSSGLEGVGECGGGGRASDSIRIRYKRIWSVFVLSFQTWNP